MTASTHRIRAITASLGVAAATAAGTALLWVALTGGAGPASADALCDAMRARFGPGWQCISVPPPASPTSPTLNPAAPTQQQGGGGVQVGSNIGPGPGDGNGTPIVPVPGQPGPQGHGGDQPPAPTTPVTVPIPSGTKTTPAATAKPTSPPAAPKPVTPHTPSAITTDKQVLRPSLTGTDNNKNTDLTTMAALAVASAGFVVGGTYTSTRRNASARMRAGGATPSLLTRGGSIRGTVGNSDLVLINDPTSPKSYTFDEHIPPGGRVRVNSDGSATVLDKNGNAVKQIAKPWAFDTLGRPQKTWYTVEDGTLVQHVAPSDNALYPILADPTESTPNPDGSVSTTVTDDAGNVVSRALSTPVPDSGGSVDTTHYDPDGNVTSTNRSVPDGHGGMTTWTSTPRGDYSVLYPDGSVATDTANPDGTSSHVETEPIGEPVPEGQTQPTQTTVQNPDGTVSTGETEFGESGPRTRIQNPDGSEAVVNSQGGVTTTYRHSDGSKTAIEPDGTVRTSGYDSNGRAWSNTSTKNIDGSVETTMWNGDEPVGIFRSWTDDNGHVHTDVIKQPPPGTPGPEGPPHDGPAAPTKNPGVSSESIPEPDGSITTLIRDDQGNVVSRLHSRYLDNGALRTDYPDGKYTEQVLGRAEDGRYVIRSLTRDGMFEQTAISDGEQILVVRKRIDSDKPYASDLYTVSGDHIATAGTDGRWSLVGAPPPAPYDPYEVPHQYGPTPIEFDTSTWTGKFEAFGFGVLKGVYSLPITVLTLSGAGPVPASDAWKALGSNILHLVNPYDPAEFGKAWSDMGKSFIGWDNDNAWVGAGEGTVNVLSLLAPGAVGKIAGGATRGATKGAVESAEEAAEQAAKLGGRDVAGGTHTPYITLPHDAPDPPPLPKNHPLFEGYHPTDPGPEYTNPDGSLRYPDASNPTKPYAVPGTVVDHVQLPPGTVLGRFGYPGGEWMAPEGTPFARLSLPPDSALKPYYEYVVKDPTKLPPGWRIEQSQTSPWFHQPGMGTQYRIIAPPGKTANIIQLLRSDFLERIGRQQ